MSTARDTSNDVVLIGRPPRNPEADLREKLLREVMHHCIELARLPEGWDGRGSVPPSTAILHRAADLGLMIVGTPST
jgi:hypothetical protein